MGSELWALPQDKRNAIEREQSRAKTLEDVIDEYRVGDRALSEVDSMSDEELNEPSRMTGLARRSPAGDRGGCSTTRVTTPTTACDRELAPADPRSRPGLATEGLDYFFFAASLFASSLIFFLPSAGSLM